MSENKKSPSPVYPTDSPPGKPLSNPASATASPPGNPSSNPASAAASPPGNQLSGPSSPVQADEVTGILPPNHWANVAQGQEYEEETESSRASTTASITSSILRYRTINGRRFHSEIGNAEYWGANDEKQNESMALNHHTICLAMGNKLFKAPLDTERISKVLDIGTGNGIWAIDFADEHEDVEVIGTDISPIQPTWIPPNLKFEIEDCTSEWTFSADSFDFIHARWMIGSIRDWTLLFKEAYTALKPGGWFETHEPSPHIHSQDETVTPSTALGQWGKIFHEGGKIIGRSFDPIGDGLQRRAMEEAGFVDIQEADLTTPIGNWPKDPELKELGTVEQMAFLADIEGYILFISMAHGWSREETQVFIAHMRYEMRSGQYHALFMQKVLWGRKPEATEG